MPRRIEGRIERLEQRLCQQDQAIRIFRFEDSQGNPQEIRFLPGMTLAKLLAEAHRRQDNVNFTESKTQTD